MLLLLLDCGPRISGWQLTVSENASSGPVNFILPRYHIIASSPVLHQGMNVQTVLETSRLWAFLYRCNPRLNKPLFQSLIVLRVLPSSPMSDSVSSMNRSTFRLITTFSALPCTSHPTQIPPFSYIYPPKPPRDVTTPPPKSTSKKQNRSKNVHPHLHNLHLLPLPQNPCNPLRLHETHRRTLASSPSRP